MDDLAAKLEMDPLQLRLKNLPPSDKPGEDSNVQAYNFIRTKLYGDQIQIAAGLVEWKEKWHAPGANKGVLKHGTGMAPHARGGQATPPKKQCPRNHSRDGPGTATASPPVL